MSRAETTAMLSKLVEKRLRNRVSYWASEVNFDLGTPRNRRIDYIGFKPFTPGYVLEPSSVELGTSPAMKSSHAWLISNRVTG
jgi:hypothetical protein